jgi:hypothetical protein
MAENKMPPELLAHFKKKQEGGGASDSSVNKNDKDRRKEAVKKARVRMEEKNRKGGHDKENKAGEKGAQKS